VAIKRPEGSEKPKQPKRIDPTPVAEILSAKKKTLDTNKEQGSKQPRINKKSTAADTKKKPTKKATSAKKPRTSTPKKKDAPKLPKNEREWVAYIEGMTIGAMLMFLDSKAGKLNVTAQHVIKKKLAEMSKLITDLPTDHNGWLEFFSNMTRDETEIYMAEHVLTLDNEARAAAQRWILIYDNPTLIDRIMTSRLQQEKSEEVGDILKAAKSGDRLKTFEAIRDNLAYKLQDGTGARDMTVLFKQLNEVMVTLDELYRETGQKDADHSSIRKLLIKSRKMAARPRARQAAATISDAEDDDDEDMN